MTTGTYIGEACEPCGDLGIGKTSTIESVYFDYDSKYNSYVPMVNGQQIDLAYTYINVNVDTYVNAANIVGCKADGVSGVLKKDLLSQ